MWMSRLRWDAPIFTRKVIRAPDDQDRLEALAQHDDERLGEQIDGRRLVAQHALRVLEATASSRRRSASSSAGVAPPAARVRSDAKAASSSAARPGFLARTPRSTCSNVMYASNARALADGIAGAGEREGRVELARAPGRRPAPSRRRCDRPGTSAPRPAGQAPRAGRIVHAERGEDASSDILPVVANARSAGGTSPRGAGTRRMLA